MEQISVDIVLITYNSAKYVRQALESVFCQSVEEHINVRVVVSDDYSSDDTLTVIHSLEPISPFPFVYVPHDKNLGISRNYQRTFAACDADYVAVLEGDDYWCAPGHLQSHISFLESHRECVMCVNSLIFFKEEDGLFKSINPNKLFNPGTYQLITQEDLLQWNYIVNFSSCVYRYSALKRINPQLWEVPVKNVDDWLVSLELSKYGLVGKLQECQTIYRLHSTNSYGGIGTYDFINDVIHRIEVYDKYFDYKYHSAFYEHLMANKAVLKKLRDDSLYNKLPKLIWWIFVGCRSCVRSIKKCPKLFLPPCVMAKIKRKFLRG